MPAWCASCKVHSNGADQEGTPSSWSHPLSPTSTVERLLAPPPCLTAAEAWQCGTREQCLLTCKRQYQPHHSSSTTRSVPDMKHLPAPDHKQSWPALRTDGGRTNLQARPKKNTSVEIIPRESVPGSRRARWMSLPERGLLVRNQMPLQPSVKILMKTLKLTVPKNGNSGRGGEDRNSIQLRFNNSRCIRCASWKY
jgi:hypothetical protein